MAAPSSQQALTLCMPDTVKHHVWLPLVAQLNVLALPCRGQKVGSAPR